ncbi:MAG: tetratricopeptide repeat protein [Chloroflexi bacterium]|nr:tetratricopeptide repeat protein [Chloroflexota bacterium]
MMLLNAIEREDAETRGVVLSNAAVVYAESADAESADAFFKEAVDLAVASDDRVAQATRLGNYGWFLLLVGRPRRAQTTLEQALVLSQELGLKLQTAVQTDNLGLVRDALGEYTAALELHEQAVQLTTDKGWQSLFRANAANSLISLGRYDDALALLDTMLVAARAQPHDDALVAGLIAQARARLAVGLHSIEPVIDEAIAVARKLDHRRLLAEALAERSRWQARQGQSDGALASWDEAQKLYLLLHMPQGKLSPDWL